MSWIQDSGNSIGKLFSISCFHREIIFGCPQLEFDLGNHFLMISLRYPSDSLVLVITLLNRGKKCCRIPCLTYASAEIGVELSKIGLLRIIVIFPCYWDILKQCYPKFLSHPTCHETFIEIHQKLIELCQFHSLRNSPPDRCPRPAKTASVQQNNCLCWSERPAISSGFWKFTFPQYCSKHVSKFKTV